MRLDHIAFRVPDRKVTAKFFQDAFGYKLQAEFQIDFPDGSTANCISLEPSEKTPYSLWTVQGPMRDDIGIHQIAVEPEYHTPPELFVSDGPAESIVGKWVLSKNGVGGVHHFAWQVDDVEATMKIWKENGWAEFTSEQPITCPGLVQVFTKPLAICGGIIHEFINRSEHGFCAANVKTLMESTAGL